MVADTGFQESHTGSRSNARLAQLRRRIAGRMAQGFYGVSKGLVLRRDLEKTLEHPKAKIPFFIRPLAEDDLDTLLPLERDMPPAERQQVIWRRHFHRKAPEGCCFVAVDERDGTPCYMQWLISASHNDALARFKCFPKLNNDEALIEQTYTIPSHRGLGIMSAAMIRISERASDFGARYVLGMAPEDIGIASIKACQRAGLYPHLVHTRIQIGYSIIVHNSFKRLSNDDPRRKWQL